MLSRLLTRLQGLFTALPLLSPKKEKWRDPTYGKIDRDIQEWVTRNYGDHMNIATRCAIESTIQGKRDRGELDW